MTNKKTAGHETSFSILKKHMHTRATALTTITASHGKILTYEYGIRYTAWHGIPFVRRPPCRCVASHRIAYVLMAQRHGAASPPHCIASHCIVQHRTACQALTYRINIVSYRITSYRIALHPPHRHTVPPRIASHTTNSPSPIPPRESYQVRITTT